jgi:hypothetical protein
MFDMENPITLSETYRGQSILMNQLLVSEIHIFRKIRSPGYIVLQFIFSKSYARSCVIQ